LKNSIFGAEALKAAARHDPSLNWYAIADSAQHRALPRTLVKQGHPVRCLFDVSENSPVAACAPHLVELDSPLKDCASWSWISLHGKARSCVSVIAAHISFEAMFSHLIQFMEVRLPDGDDMFFAFWDSAILGTLIGQSDDLTLHVKGPVLTPVQRNALMSPISQWWYWDRTGELHVAAEEKLDCPRALLPLRLSQSQIDNLVEATVPDHILYYLELNQPMLVDHVAPSLRYEFVQRALLRARDIGLLSMGDLVNYVCLELIYRDRLYQDEIIIDLLGDVKNGKATFLEVIEKMP
jgi:hypothetical protein